MSNIYEALISLIGEPPIGTEWLVYTMACLLVFMVITSFVNLFGYILRWVGGIK